MGSQRSRLIKYTLLNISSCNSHLTVNKNYRILEFSQGLMNVIEDSKVLIM